MEQLYLSVLAANIPDQESLAAMFNDIWDQGWSKNIRIDGLGRSADDYRLQGERMVREYHVKYHPFDQMELLRVECKESMPLPDGNAYHIRIDRLEKQGNCYYVNDYKTGRLPAAAEDVDRQLSLYSLWVLRNYPAVGTVRQRWYYLGGGVERTREYTIEELQEAEREVVRSIAKIQSCTSFVPNPGRLCDYCEYLEICPEFVKRTIGKGENACSLADAQARPLIDEFVELDSERKRIEGRMKNIKTMLINLSLETGIGEFDTETKKAVIKKESRIKTPENMEQMLRDVGLFDKYSQFSFSRAESAVKKGTAEPELMQLVQMVEEPSVRISARGRKSTEGLEENS